MYRQEVTSVYAFMYRLGAPRSELADLTHEVFATAISKWSTFDRSRPLRPWLMGIAWRAASDWRAKKKPELVEALPEQEADERADASLEANEARRLVQRGLAKLDETKRAAFVLHELQGLSVNEVSEAMAAPLQTT